MNATVSSLGAPPLPLVLDLAALTCFCTESLDDAVEDAVKLCVLSTAGWLVWRLLRRTRCGTRAARAGVVCTLAALHPLANDVADAAGDLMAPVQAWLLRLGGSPSSDAATRQLSMRERQRRAVTLESLCRLLPTSVLRRLLPPPAPTAAPLSRVRSAVDDLVEDAFKLSCVGAHVCFGSLLHTSVATAAPDSQLVRAAALLVALGAPASQYRACDEYGDRLGDRVQQWFDRGY